MYVKRFPQSIGIRMPSLEVKDLFPFIKLGKVLPRKSFSMGCATAKRYYLESQINQDKNERRFKNETCLQFFCRTSNITRRGFKRSSSMRCLIIRLWYVSDGNEPSLKIYQQIIDEAEQDLRTLMQIPDNYKVLFLQGGATLQFSMIPINLMKNGVADYIVTGHWAKKAAEEASKICKSEYYSIFRR
jgi:hypothetical protein